MTPRRPPVRVSRPSRLAALDAYGILDTPPEKGFDDIVQLARKAFATPVALVSLVAGDRQWFKASVGFEPCETTLDKSVCAHVLGQPDLLVIPDLREDHRTRDNPLVTGDPFLRFYAGAPLDAAIGGCLGSLCVIDVEPRPDGLTTDQAESLRALARQVMAQLELRRSLAERDGMIAIQRATVVQHEALLAARPPSWDRAGGTTTSSTRSSAASSGPCPRPRAASRDAGGRRTRLPARRRNLLRHAAFACRSTAACRVRACCPDGRGRCRTCSTTPT